MPEKVAAELITGPSIEKSNAPLRSFVAAPMRSGRLLLAGAAAHIVPPTGARGLNSAASDIYNLYHAMVAHYRDGNDSGLDGYSSKALARVWKGQRFSWWMTTMLHRFPGNLPYEDKLQDTELPISSLHRGHGARSPRTASACRSDGSCRVECPTPPWISGGVISLFVLEYVQRVFQRKWCTTVAVAPFCISIYLTNRDEWFCLDRSYNDASRTPRHETR